MVDSIKIEIKLTVEQMSKTFASMGCDEQAQFLAETWKQLEHRCGGDYHRKNQCLMIRDSMINYPGAQEFVEELREPEPEHRVIDSGERRPITSTKKVEGVVVDIENPFVFNDLKVTDPSDIAALTGLNIESAMADAPVSRCHGCGVPTTEQCDSLCVVQGGQKYRGWDLAADTKQAEDRTHRGGYTLTELREIARNELGDSYSEFRNLATNAHYFASSTEPDMLIWTYRKEPTDGTSNKVVFGRITSLLEVPSVGC